MKQDDIDIKYCLYARKSSEQDERQAMSIDSQLKEMADMAQAQGLEIVTIKQESHSAKLSGKRPVFLEMLEDIRAEKFNGILTWAPDRLSRNAGDLGSLVDLMDMKKLAHIKTHSQEFSNNPNEKFLLMILCSQAKLENDNRAINVKRGIRAKCERGWRPCMPPLGYFTQAANGDERHTVVDEARAPYIVKMFEMSADGKSGRHIKRYLINEGVRSRKDKEIALSMIYKILKNTFYYGEFEYPSGSGNWYQGKHDPLITKDLYDKVQEQLKVPAKTKWGSKEFPYKQFMKCYSCGSSIVGEKKNRTYKNGNKQTFTYYHCSRQVDYSCKEPYAREEAISKQLIAMCNELVKSLGDLDPTLQRAIDKFSRMMAVTYDEANQSKVIEGYVKYVLRNGTNYEKTRLIKNLNIELALKNRCMITVS